MQVLSRVLAGLLATAAVACRTAAVSGQLPADSGQVWKTYDIGPFVKQSGPGTQRHVVDWVLQETGYSSWHGDLVASLSADETSLRCYHTPAMQARVAEIASRFTQEAAVAHRFSVRVLGIGSPSWRTDARGMLRPIPAATPGVQAWIMSREEGRCCWPTSGRRSDCQELPTGPVLAGNGLPAVVSGGRKLSYVQDVVPRTDAWPGWQMLGGACDEGMAIDVQPLLSLDGTAVDAVFRCRIDQIERMGAARHDRADRTAAGPGRGAAGFCGSDRGAVSLAGKPDADRRSGVGALAGSRSEFRGFVGPADDRQADGRRRGGGAATRHPSIMRSRRLPDPEPDSCPELTHSQTVQVVFREQEPLHA